MKPAQPELAFDPRPRVIVTDTAAEFFALCEREKAGELEFEAVEIGERNGQWVCRVRWG
jgi:hypothetical protein